MTLLEASHKHFPIQYSHTNLAGDVAEYAKRVYPPEGWMRNINPSSITFVHRNLRLPMLKITYMPLRIYVDRKVNGKVTSKTVDPPNWASVVPMAQALLEELNEEIQSRINR